MLDKKEKRDVSIKGVKMHSAGLPYPKIMKNEPVVSEGSRVSYPSLYLNAKQAPSLIGKKVGDEVTMLIKAKVTSYSKNDSANGDSRESFDLQIKQMGCLDTKK